jgi:hypothetical protein
VATVLETARARSVGASPVKDCWVATPVHFLPGLTQVHAPLDTVLVLPQDEADELAQSFQAVWGRDTALRLLPAGTAGFLLQGLPRGQVTSVEPADLRGRNLEHCQPRGEGATVLRKLMSEIEMWLHDHPLNRRREVRGVPAISSLWLWGADGDETSGARASSEMAWPETAWPETAGGRLLPCVSEDPWLEAACELLDAVPLPLPESARALWSRAALRDAREPVLVICPGWDLDRLQRDWLQPLGEALIDGALTRLQLETADQSLTLQDRDRWRIWRKPVSLLEALGGHS